MSDIDKTVLIGLQKTLDATTRAYWDVQGRRSARENELRKALNEKLNAEFGAEMEATSRAKNEAESAVRIEVNRIREIESMASLPYPIGTKLVEWKAPSWSYQAPMSKTGDVAVLEVFKDGDPIPANVRYSRPHVGAIVLRSLKKDGSRAARADEWSPSSKNYWFPEGVDPNAKKAE